MGRQLIWTGSSGGVDANISDIQAYDIIAGTEMDNYGAATVTRIIQSLRFTNGAVANNVIYAGIAVVPVNSTTATMPNPGSDMDYPWLFRKAIPLVGASEVQTLDTIFDDIRSQRKMKRNEKLVLVMDDIQGDYDLSGRDHRVLLRLG